MIEDMRKLAQVKNGDYLSDQYYDLQTKLKWINENIHKWEAVHYSIQQGSWCLYCAVV
jgi:hypothetical protein